MRHPACSIVVLGTLLLPVTTTARPVTDPHALRASAGTSVVNTWGAPNAQSPSGVNVVARESVTPLAGASRAADVDNRVNPIAEQALMAVLLVGLAAALRRWQPGKRPRPSQQSRS